MPPKSRCISVTGGCRNSAQSTRYTFNLGLAAHCKQDEDQLEGQAVETATRSSERVPSEFTKLIIIPEGNQSAKTHIFLELWDTCTCIFLFLTAIIVPYEAVIVTQWELSMFAPFGRLADVFFTCDIVLQFFIAYPNRYGNNSRNMWVRDPVLIAKRYMFTIPGWFWIDVLSVLPGWLELSAAVIRRDISLSGPSKLLVIFRAFRLARMLKLLRLARLVDRWQAEIELSYFTRELITFFTITTFTCHWGACLWVLAVGKIMLQNQELVFSEEPSWLKSVLSNNGNPCFGANANTACVYTLALYWATMTLTTVGYGDVVPKNLFEYALCTLLMLMSGYIWAYIVGSVVSLLSGLDPLAMAFKNNMDSLNMMMKDRDLPGPLQGRLRNYMHHSNSLAYLKAQQELIQNTISEGLQREIAECSSSLGFLKCIWWTRGVGDEERSEMVRAMTFDCFGPSEVVTLRETMILIRKGLMAAKGRILSRGDAWGHDGILLVSSWLQEDNGPRTLSYVDCLRLDRSALLRICGLFPRFNRHLRRAQVRVAANRAFCIAGALLSGEEQANEKTFKRDQGWVSIQPVCFTDFCDETSLFQDFVTSNLTQSDVLSVRRHKDVTQRIDKLRAEVDWFAAHHRM